MIQHRLSDIAPRLGRARDQLLVEWAQAALRRRRAERQLLSQERLVAHRDLQLARAYTTRNGKYIDQRRRKLAAAQRKLDYLRREAA